MPDECFIDSNDYEIGDSRPEESDNFYMTKIEEVKKTVNRFKTSSDCV